MMMLPVMTKMSNEDDEDAADQHHGKDYADDNSELLLV